VGQKVHPIGFRLGVIKDSQARWYADKRGFTQYLHEDLRVRRMIMGRLADAGVSRVEIERSANQMTVTIYAAKPGIVIGKSGVKVEELRKNLETMTAKKVRVTIQEIRQPELDAYLVSRSVAEQLEKRVAFRRAMKQAIGRAMRFGAKGIRVQVSGRLGGAEMSRREGDRDGRVPLHTLRADIDFGQSEARTTYGIIGVKVWIYRGEVLGPGREPPAGSVAGRPATGRMGGRPEAPAGAPAMAAPTASRAAPPPPPTPTPAAAASAGPVPAPTAAASPGAPVVESAAPGAPAVDPASSAPPEPAATETARPAPAASEPSASAEQPSASAQPTSAAEAPPAPTPRARSPRAPRAAAPKPAEESAPEPAEERAPEPGDGEA
jgi:small subunit ribosomal protein S3